ncbi:MAG: Mrp/NBP35 family ATP-binding protein [Victivallales bacterium]|nr:Mrp/NBP35 family ATP-binding protein [Victivallales bacterium]MCF7889334.1 Mrp/NBP35 family ATP-binding protein [Victivallales bacterium]
MSQQDCSGCTDNSCSAKQKKTGESEEHFHERQARQERMCRIKRKVMVLSGKGGVGKSTVAVNMAISLAVRGARVGLIDADIHGPSIPKMLDLEKAQVRGGYKRNSILPIDYSKTLKIMSIGFFLESGDSALIWRGPRKYGLIKQFLEEVEWGELDYLIFDLPPGTGDEPLSICQLIDDMDGAVIVTTPQDVAISDVRKSITFCRHLDLPVLGIIENMSGFVCPNCGEVTYIFGKDGAEKMSKDMQVPVLGKIPIDPGIVSNGDSGKTFVIENKSCKVSEEFSKIVSKISEVLEK